MVYPNTYGSPDGGEGESPRQFRGSKREIFREILSPLRRQTTQPTLVEFRKSHAEVTEDYSGPSGPNNFQASIRLGQIEDEDEQKGSKSMFLNADSATRRRSGRNGRESWLAAVSVKMTGTLLLKLKVRRSNQLPRSTVRHRRLNNSSAAPM